eukprot:1213642-Prymnesium_polylepis.2
MTPHAHLTHTSARTRRLSPPTRTQPSSHARDAQALTRTIHAHLCAAQVTRFLTQSNAMLARALSDEREALGLKAGGELHQLPYAAVHLRLGDACRLRGVPGNATCNECKQPLVCKKLDYFMPHIQHTLDRCARAHVSGGRVGGVWGRAGHVQEGWCCPRRGHSQQLLNSALCSHQRHVSGMCGRACTHSMTAHVRSFAHTAIHRPARPPPGTRLAGTQHERCLPPLATPDPTAFEKLADYPNITWLRRPVSMLTMNTSDPEYGLEKWLYLRRTNARDEWVKFMVRHTRPAVPCMLCAALCADAFVVC